MTEQRSNSNFFVFLITSTILALGWIWIGQIIWPPQNKPDQVARDEAGKNSDSKSDKAETAKGDQPAPGSPEAKAGNTVGMQARPASSGPLNWINTPEAELVSLGSEGHLQVWFDPRGAMVRQVRLRDFGGADSDGKATGEKLDLIPRSPIPNCQEYQPGSFGLLHYPKGATEQPSDELLKRVWKHKTAKFQTKDGGSGDEVVFETEVDGIKVVKTFRLAPGDYHIDLNVSASSADGAEHPFRYQIVGPRGLPIEGDWYVQVFRNAVFGLERDNGAFERLVHDMRAMASSLGSEPAPLGGDPASPKRLRFAGIQTQYFASVIALRDPKVVPIRHCQSTVETAVSRGYLVDYDPAKGQIDILTGGGQQQPSRSSFRISKALADRFGGLGPDSKPVMDGVSLPSREVSILYTWEPEAGPNSHQFVAMDLVDPNATNTLWVSDATVRLGTETVALKPGSAISHDYVLYNGPAKPSLMSFFRGEKSVQSSVIKQYTEGLRLYSLVDYPSAFGSWFLCGGFSKVVMFFTNLMHQVLGYMHLVIPGYGLCIILLTVLVRLSMFPISKRQALSNLKMQALAPQLKELQKKHQGDAQALARAQMDMYKKYGINPASGCLPVFLQMPIFMGLYFAFQESIELRLHAMDFTWIKNLASPDMMFYWGESVPFLTRPVDYGGFVYLGPFFNLLPIFSMGLMVVQQKLFMPPPANDDMKNQQNMMLYMSVFMSVLFYRVPAGLCIYFITSSIWGLTERQLLKPAKNADLSSLLTVRENKPADAKPGIFGQWMNTLRQKIEDQANPKKQGKKR
jgi:YidC/Oxa1 family membrane protein insertase